jgi:hypothetical protein
MKEMTDLTTGSREGKREVEVFVAYLPFNSGR